jgi:hypothetical protein
MKGQEHNALANLPDFSLPDKQAQKANGTNGENITDESLSFSSFQN